jgi:hypothetical protein
MNYDDWKTDPEFDRKEEIEEEDPDQAMERKQERDLMEREEREGKW